MVTLVLGGARSGKSRYAVSLCAEAPRVRFIATATAGDDEEMAARIARHRDARPQHWEVVEAPLDLAGALAKTPPDVLVLVDCVTLWLSNALYARRDLDRDERERQVLAETDRFVAASAGRTVVTVSNEVGSGLVPLTPVGREFRDLQGVVNQRLAAAADHVVWVVAGLPLPLKR